MPQAEPEYTITKRRGRRRGRPPIPDGRWTDLFSLSPDGRAARRVGRGEVVPIDTFGADGLYVIEWNGSAITVDIRRFGSPLGLLGVAAVEPITPILDVGVAELEPRLLGRVVFVAAPEGA